MRRRACATGVRAQAYARGLAATCLASQLGGKQNPTQGAMPRKESTRTMAAHPDTQPPPAIPPPHPQVWALGVCLYECCARRMPFDADNQAALILKILRGRYPPVEGYGPELLGVLGACLALVGVPCVWGERG